MLLKKSFILGSALALLSLPVIATAEPILKTYNYTDEDSAVLIPATGLCSGSLGFFTPKRKNASTFGYLETKLSQAKWLCGALGGICKATMYANATCTGTAIAKVELNLDTGSTKVTDAPKKTYQIIASGLKVEIKYNK